MREKWKRFLSIILTLITMITSVPVYASTSAKTDPTKETSVGIIKPPDDAETLCTLVHKTNDGVSLASLDNSDDLKINHQRYDVYWNKDVITSPSSTLNLGMALKWIDNDGSNPDANGKWRMVYCLEWQKSAPAGDLTYNDKWTNMRVHYAMYYGCMYWGETCRYSGYSANTGDWRDDYVVTQTAVHVLNNEFSLDEAKAAINNADPQAALAKEPGLTNLNGVTSPSSATKTKVINAIEKLVTDARDNANYSGWDTSDGWFKLTDSNTTYDVSGYQDTWTKNSDGNYYSGGDFHITFNSYYGFDMRDQIDKVDITVPSGVSVKKKDSKTYSDFDLYISENQYNEWSATGKDIPVTVKITLHGWWGCAIYEPKDTTLQPIGFQTWTSKGGNYTVSKTVTLHISQDPALVEQNFKIEVTKTDSLTGEGIEGCEFTVYEYNPSNSKYVVLGKLGWDSTAKKYTSDANSQLKAVLKGTYNDSGNQGKFKIVETSVPNGYASSSAWSKEFVVAQTDAEQTLKFTYDVTNDPTRILIKKVDENGNTITGAHLEVYDSDNKKVAEFDSASAGVEVDRLVAGKTYTLKETSVPAGYVKSDDVTFTVQDTKDVQTVTMTDKWTVTTFDKQLFSDKATYVKGASLELRTDKDDASSIVTTVTGTKVQWTSGTGNQTFYGIKPGTYWLVETKAPDGYATADPIQVTISASTSNHAALYNDKTKILIKKVDENGNTITGAHLVVYDSSNNKVGEFDSTTAGVQIEGLVAGKRYTVKETVVPAGYVKSDDVTFTVQDTKDVQTVTMTDKWTVTTFDKQLFSDKATYVKGASLELRTDKDDASSVVTTVTGTKVQWSSGTGNQTFYGIRPGTYWLVETKAPDGYATADPIQVTISASTSNHAALYNDKTKILIKKVDENGNTITGAHLVVYDSSNKKVGEFDSTTAGVQIEGLVAGKNYTIKETVVPDGYVKSNDVTFTVQDTKDVQTVTMTDKWTVTTFDKQLYSDKSTYVKGASLELRTDKDKADSVVTTVTGTKVQWTSGTGNQTFYGIRPGTYWLVETKAPDGYATADPIQVTISASTSNHAALYNDKTKILIKKVDENGNTITGAHLVVYDSSNKKVGEFDSTSAGVQLEGLLVGKNYTMKETVVPDGYVKSNDVTFTVKDTKDVQTVTMTDKWTVTEIHKQLLSDRTTYVTGASLELRTDKSNANSVVRTVDGIQVKWTSGTGKQTFYGIKPGTYWLVETQAPDGYVTSEPVQVTVTSSLTNTAVMYNDPTHVLIRKVDENGDPIIGAHLQLFDSSGNKIREFDSTADGVEIQLLAVGKQYTVKETVVPAGYVKADDVTFTVKDVSGMQDITMKDPWTLTEISKLSLADKKTFVSGASLELRTNKDNPDTVVTTVTGTKVQWTSGSGKQSFYGIKPGTYWLVETKPPAGYALSDPVQVTVTASRINTGIMYDLPYADLTVVKRIRADHINFANGNPTFIFTVKGNDLLGNYHEYSEYFEFTKDYVQRNTGSDGYVSMSYTWKSIPVGTSYNVMENETNRYYLADVTSQDSNVSISRLKTSAYGVRPEDTFRVTADLQTKPTGTTITFINTKYAWGDWGHNAIVKNTVKIVQS